MTVQDYQMPQRSAEIKEYEVRTSGSNYLLKDPIERVNPTLTLRRGGTYIFTIATTQDPFWIKTAQVTGTGSAYNNGVTNNGAVRTTVNGVSVYGVVTFVVPQNAPNTLYYISQNTATRTGILNIVDGGVGLSPQEISFSAIQEEYGGKEPISLNEYYSGGPYVPTGMSGFRGAVPSSGPISTEDLSRIGLVNIIGRQWSPSFAVDRAMGAINDDGQIFFTSVGYDTSLQSWVMPTGSFTADGRELWSSKLKFIHGVGIPYNNSTFCLNSGNFVIAGGNTARLANDKPSGFIVEIKKDSLSYTDSLKIKKLWHPSNDLKPQHVHWVKDSNDQYFYMIALLTATNSFMVVKVAGPIENMSPSSIIWAKRYQFGSTNASGVQRAGTVINYVSSFLYVPAKNQIFISLDLTYPASNAVQNNNAFEIVGFDCNDGKIVKYITNYRSSTTGVVNTRFLRCVLTDSNSEGDLFGNYVYFITDSQNVAERAFGFKLPNRTVGNQNEQYNRDYGFETRNYPDTFVMNMGTFWDNIAWLTDNRPVKTILINEDQANTNRTATSIYQNPDSVGDVINIWTQRMTPLNDDTTIPTITNGRVIVLNGSNSVPTGGHASGIYAWYLKDNDYSITNQNLDLYNYSSVFQQPTNKRNIAFVAKTQNSSVTNQPQFIISVFPRFRQIQYYLPSVFYQRLGELPRWPDLEQRPPEQGYGKLIYGPTSRYNYDTGVNFQQEGYYFYDWTVTDLSPSSFLFDTSLQANDWLGWDTSQGNPITKTSFYPNTTYTVVTPTTFSFTLNSNYQEMNLRNFCLANGWNGIDPVVFTVASNVYIWSDNRAIPALTINGSFPGGITLVNNGFIIGRGGNGHTYTNSGRVLAQSGGTAISLGTNITIQNNSTIAGGGGGGGSTVVTAYGAVQATISPGGGGGAGGGIGGNGRDTYYGYPDAPGGSGGSPGNAGSNGSFSVWYDYYSTYGSVGGGGGGGRVLPGTGGAGGQGSSSNLENSFGRGGGAGGGGGAYITSAGANALGGAGGSTNSTGVTATIVNGFYGGGGGGGWGASGGGPGTAGSGGAAVTQAGYTVTWTSVGTRYGAIVT